MILVVIGTLLWPGRADAIIGFEDNNNLFPWTVRLDISPGPTNPPGGPTICTGTLVSRRWVLTAAHCMPPNGGATTDWSVAVSAGMAPVTSNYGHTSTGLNNQGPIIYADNGTYVFNGSSTANVSRDLALVRLNALVPYGLAGRTIPLHPGILEGGWPCNPSSGLDGTEVGYGDGWNFAGDPVCFECPCVYAGRRAPRTFFTGPFADWTREPADQGATYNGPLTSKCGFGAVMHGDSGGPLLWQIGLGYQQCGVSALVEREFDPSAPFFPAREARYAAIDSPIGIALLQNVLYNSPQKGAPTPYYEGECPDSYWGAQADWPGVSRDLGIPGIPDICECRAAYDANDWSDVDNDGVFDLCDNCLPPQRLCTDCTTANPDQTDTDDDRIGDLCDACPTHKGIKDVDDMDHDGCPDSLCDPAKHFGSLADPVYGWEYPTGYFAKTCGDADQDGIPDNEDDCPWTADPDQKNANAIEENFHHPLQVLFLPQNAGGVLGDACDPAPTPLLDVTPAEIQELATEPPFTRYVVLAENDIALTPQASRGHTTSWFTSPASTASAAPTIPLWGPQSPPTHFRFCQNGSLPNLGCTDRLAVAYGQLLDGQVQTVMGELGQPYHRVHLAVDWNNPQTLAWGASKTFAYTGTGQIQDPWTWVTWDYQTDFAAWNHVLFDVPTLPGIPCGPGCLCEDGSACPGHLFPNPPEAGLKGWFWALAQTPVSVSQDLGSGLHPTDTGLSELSSLHIPIQPVHIAVVKSAAPVLEPLQSNYPFFIWMTLPDPSPDEIDPWGDFRVRPGEASLLLPARDGELSLLGANGKVQSIQTHIDAAVAASLADPSLVWAPSAETGAKVGGIDVPAAVAFDAYGTTLVQRARIDRTASALVGDGSPAGSSTAPSVGPNPSFGFAAVYSKRLHRAFLLGGYDLAGAPVSSLRSVSVGSGVWDSVPLTAPLGQVLAATVRADGSLAVMDEMTGGTSSSGGPAMWRLLRIDPASGEMQVLGSWVKGTRWDHLWFELDADRQLLLVLSNQLGAEHAVVRVASTSTGGLSLRIAEAGIGALAFPLAIDRKGYVIYRKGPGIAGEVIQPERVAALGDLGDGSSLLVGP